MPPLAKPPDILAAFGATKSHSPGTKPSAMQMAADRDLRQRPTVTYAESDESSPEDTPRTDRSFQDPLSSTTSVAPGVGDSENESEGESESESDDEITGEVSVLLHHEHPLTKHKSSRVRQYQVAEPGFNVLHASP